MNAVPGETGEESAQQRQHIRQVSIQHNDKIRFVILCCSLLALALAFVIFFLTSMFIPIFITLVVTFLGYQHLDTQFRNAERKAERGE